MAYPVSAIKPSSAPVQLPSQKSSGGGFFRSLATLVVLLIIIGGAIYFVGGFSGINSFLPGLAKFKSEWQAVFLTNGQVYFGQVSKVDPTFITLENIYYLQVSSQQDTIGQPPDVQQQPEQRLTLIKLGNELHGPQDYMMVNRDHVVIIEDLKDDSRVIQAINDYIKAKE